MTIVGTTGGESITLSPAFRNNTFTYTTSVANGIDAVTLTATKNESTATVAITGDADTSTPNEADLHLDVGDNTLTVTVTADDTITTETYTVTVTRDAPQVEAKFYVTWSLKPSSLVIGDQFRLLFLSSTKRNAHVIGHSGLQHVRPRPGRGRPCRHPNLQSTASPQWAAPGRLMPAITPAPSITSSDKGVPIYWLNGPKLADQYQDFYDGSWDAESNSQDRNQLGNNGTDTYTESNQTWTGCEHNGTEAFLNGNSRALGRSHVRTGSMYTGGPISSGVESTATTTHLPPHVRPL